MPKQAAITILIILNITVLVLLYEYIYSYWILIFPGLVLANAVFTELLNLDVEPQTIVAISWLLILLVLFVLFMIWIFGGSIVALFFPELKEKMLLLLKTN